MSAPQPPSWHDPELGLSEFEVALLDAIAASPMHVRRAVLPMLMSRPRPCRHGSTDLECTLCWILPSIAGGAS